jgi:type I restriction enzyme S subunit
MKSSYKRLGEYIEPVDEFNVGNEIKQLLGISNKKHFQKSQTNTIGIDLAKYRVVRDNHFAFNRATTRNSDKISIALKQGGDCIVSPSYRIFRSKDENKLNSEYLWMWFCRPEFDRYARFKSHGSAHEFFDMDEMQEVTLPIPHINKQREIVAEYNTIQNRIKLNEQLIQKLEETAQAIYREVIEKNQCEEYALKDLCSFQEGYVNPSQEYAKYFDGNIKWLRANDVNGGFILNTSRTLTEEGFNSAGTSALLFNPQTIVITKSGTIGRLGILCDYMCGNRAVINIKPKEDDNLPLIFFLLKSKYNELVDMAVGSAQANLYVPILASLKINLPDKKDITRFNLASKSLLELMKFKTIENQKLTELKDLLLSKLATVE